MDGERSASPQGLRPAPAGPPIPEEVTGRELDREIRSQLVSLGTHGSALVARHLVMVGQLLDDEPERAWEHALAARARGARIGVVREAVGLAAYHTGRYAQALAELRTMRRLTGSSAHLPVMADCERGLGRPERALALAGSAEAARLGVAERIELRIVAAGARVDLGQPEAAVVMLHLPELESDSGEEWVSRLRAAYASALAAAGRTDEASHWAARSGMALPTDESDQAGAEDEPELFDLEDEQ